MARYALDVHFRQEDVSPEALARRTVVVIDVLRATTSLAAALAAGAREAWCFRSVPQVYRARKRLGKRAFLLCGERRGVRIRGFDLGNSPRDFTSAQCEGRTLLMTTTNGTRALCLARRASEIVTASFVNIRAVVKRIHKDKGDLALLCAGTNGQVSMDDAACAGALIEALGDQERSLSRQAEEAVRIWRGAKRSLTEFLLASEGGVPLVQAGLGRDVHDCARRNRYDVVPRVAGWSEDGRACRLIAP